MHRPDGSRGSPVRGARLLASLIVVLALVATGSPAASLAQGDAPPDPAAAPIALGDGPLTAGTYSTIPFVIPGNALCLELPQPGCSETPEDDDLRLTFTVPEGWTGLEGWMLHPTAAGYLTPGGASLIPMRGGWLRSDPCLTPTPPDIPVGPTVDDFVGALVDHPLLDVTTPVDVTLAGYSGKYLELQVPSDLAGCEYIVWEPGIWTQGPGHQWHIWVLDVDGLRVVLRADSFPGTSPQVQAELLAIVDSAHIDHAPAAVAASPRPAIGEAADDGARIVAVDTVDARTQDLTIELPSVGTVQVRLLLPAGFEAAAAADWPVLYLLHGHNGGHADWTDLTDVEALTAQTDLLVVMPDAASGWYSDAWNSGAGGPPAWETFHTTELIELLERNWQASEERVVAGLSMGGLGAIAYAARHPGLFKAAASYSGVLDPRASDTNPGASATWGDPVAQEDIWRSHDPMSLAPELAGIPLYLSYGSGGAGPLDVGPVDPDDLEAAIGAENDAFVARLQELGIEATVDAYGPGTHTWPYWQRGLHASLPMLLEALGEPMAAAPSPTALPATGVLDAGTYFAAKPYRDCKRECSMDTRHHRHGPGWLGSQR